MPIGAVTFDFWRTLFAEKGNQAARQQIRMDAFVRATGVSEARATEAFTVSYAEFERSHQVDQRTLRPMDAVRMMAQHLGIGIPNEAARELAETFATAILQYPPYPIEGALDAVRAAAELYPVGVISDVGMSPSDSIRELLERNGFIPYLDILVFSDQMGVSKPQAPMFRAAAEALGVQPEELLHIGDLEYTDVVGALGVGATAVLFAGDNAAFLGQTKAQHSFTRWQDFIEALPALG